MSLLQELLAEGKRGKKKTSRVVRKNDAESAPQQVNNYVAKHAQNKTGAGQHVDKNGQKAPRNRQKRDWKKDVRNDM